MIEKVGPVGGDGGHPFGDYIIPDGSRVSELHLFANQVIHAIQIVFKSEEGITGKLPRIGGDGGTQHIVFIDDDEFITGLSGRSGWFIDNLTVHTNKKVSEAIGGEGGEQAFELSAPEGSQIIGFFGRADWYLDQVGVVAASLPKSAKPKAKPKKKKKAADPAKELQKVEGIGPKIASLLITNGIPDLAALAKADVGTLEEILKAAGRRYAIANPSTWPEQAALGAKGDWDGLTALQDSLKGGRRV